jgi:zinc transport system permease protein
VSAESLIALLLIGATSSLLGVPLLLMRLGFLSAGLSHSLLGGLAIASATGLNPLYLMTLYSLLVGNLINFLSSKGKVSGDTATAIFFTSGVALGIVLLGVSEEGADHLAEAVVGEPFRVGKVELLIAGFLFIFSLLFLLSLWRSILLLTFSREVAVAYGVKAGPLSYAVVSLASLTVVVGVKVVGILLASSLFIIPAMSSVLLGKGFRFSLLASPLITVLAVLSGSFLADRAGLQPGGVIVLILLAVFLVLSLGGRVRRSGQ